MVQRVLFCLLATTALLSADTLVLRDGSRIDGSFLGGDNRSIRFAVGDQVNTYNLTDVDSISFTSPPPSSTPPNSPPPAANATQASPPSAAPAPAAAPIEVAAGTQIVVRLIDPVNSERDSLGQTYRASLDQPLIVNGQTVVPRGADATITLINDQQSGKIAGRTVLTLQMKTMTVNGRSYDVITGPVKQASSSRGARSAKVIGGTTALGAVLGGIAGGGRGAAIGAGSGAAVGTTAQIVTSGQKVKVPPETRLTFVLQSPLNL